VQAGLVWNGGCYAVRMIIKSLEDLKVYQSANRLADEISAIIERPRFRLFPQLRKQLAEASAAIGPRISEGYGQGTDRHCAHFQRIARGSSNEMLAHLSVARGRRCITDKEHERLTGAYVQVGKMLTKWIQHLEREDRKHR
jgi:four helix bundle protein